MCVGACVCAYVYVYVYVRKSVCAHVRASGNNILGLILSHTICLGLRVQGRWTGSSRSRGMCNDNCQSSALQGTGFHSSDRSPVDGAQNTVTCGD